MIRYLLRRFGLALLTIWAISMVAFLIIQLPPGDYITTYISRLGEAGTSTSEQQLAILREQYGLDQPLWVQYGKWMSLVLQGQFGLSLLYVRPVADVVGERLALTMVVSIAALAFTWILAIPIGIYSAVRQYSIGDYVFTIVGFIGLAVPSFLLALVLLYLSFVYFGANIGGLFSPEFEDAPWSVAKLMDLLGHLPIPALVLGSAGTAQLVRVLRANLLDELRKPYVTTARAKGLSEQVLISKYPVRVALNPFASTIGFVFPTIVSGSIIISTVLSLPTVGPVLLAALQAQDMFLAGAIVLLLGVMTVIGTFVSDLILAWLDPRVRRARAA
ncbi:MAG TPA: ABC transporter permease [Candidatus Limnocylindrales bacterium]|jgi:peptide/nickel transport system permease protein